VTEVNRPTLWDTLTAIGANPFSPWMAISLSRGPLENAGLDVGDVITRYNDRAVGNHDDLRRAMMGKQSGTIQLGFLRDGKVMEGQFPVESIRILDRARRFLQVRGIDNPEISLKVHGFELLSGKVFSQAGVRTVNLNGTERTAIEAILGAGIARTLGEDVDKATLEEGDLFYLGDSEQPFVVAGISSTAGSTFDSEIWAKQSLVGRKFGKNNYTTVVLRTGGAEEAAALSRELRDDFKKAAVRARTEQEYYSSLNSTNQQFLYAISFVAAIVTVGGILGLMNTMFAAISQRMKDIGVLRILGYSGFQVLAAFLCEALILAFIGGLLGCAAGSLADGFTANSIISSGQGGGKSVVLRMTVDGTIILYGMGVAMLIGLLGGAIPAFNATRIKPLEALR
jgi:ABC-type antimicrobial peptide transport system permease subunit